MRGTDLIQATVSIFCLHLLLASFSPLSTLLASQSRTELKIKQLRRHTKHKETPTSSFSIFIWFSHSSMQTTRTIPVSPSTANNRALHRNGTAATRIGAEQKGQQRCTTNTSSRATACRQSLRLRGKHATFRHLRLCTNHTARTAAKARDFASCVCFIIKRISPERESGSSDKKTYPACRPCKAVIGKVSSNQNDKPKVEAIHSIRKIPGAIKLTRTGAKNKDRLFKTVKKKNYHTYVARLTLLLECYCC